MEVGTMFEAINYNTGKTVKALQIFRDASYLKPENDRWFAPEAEILNVDDMIAAGGCDLWKNTGCDYKIQL